ncbi:MAG: tetratricopeptide repeat protein [Deltaproteobacteria bacterium]|nr:tetratricopeptide repeat protein [Deltaproteobacteria bacterium]
MEWSLKKTDEADRLLREALRLDPKDTHALRVLGQVRWSLNDYDEAERLLREAVRLDPDDSAAWRVLGTLLERVPPEETMQKVVACLQNIVRLEPHLKSAHESLAFLLHCKLGRHQEALAHYRAALDSTAPDPNLLANLAGLLLSTEVFLNVMEALEYLRDAERRL